MRSSDGVDSTQVTSFYQVILSAPEDGTHDPTIHSGALEWKRDAAEAPMKSE